MQSGKTGCTYFLAKPIQRLGRPIPPTEAFRQPIDLIDGKERTIVNFPIRWMQKVRFDDIISHSFERFRCDSSGIKQHGNTVSGKRMTVRPVMIGPHQGIVEPVGIRRFLKPFPQSLLQKRAIVVIIPVKQKGGDSTVCSGIDLSTHNGWIRLVLISPQRHLGLLMPGKTRPGNFHQFPLRPT